MKVELVKLQDIANSVGIGLLIKHCRHFLIKYKDESPVIKLTLVHEKDTTRCEHFYLQFDSDYDGKYFSSDYRGLKMTDRLAAVLSVETFISLVVQWFSGYIDIAVSDKSIGVM